MSFEGRVIAIAGGASGIGLATAQLLASKGAHISLADLDPKVEAEAAALPGGSKKHIHVIVDVQHADAVNLWIEATINIFGKLDGAVNMAGILTKATPLAETTDEDWDKCFAVNAKGTFNCLRAEIKAMGEGGSIVSAASVFGQFGAVGCAPYCATKSAVTSMTQVAAKENPTLRINCVAPGLIDTPMLRSQNHEAVDKNSDLTVMKRRADPEEVAKVIAFLLSEEASFVTGACWNVDGGWVC